VRLQKYKTDKLRMDLNWALKQFVVEPSNLRIPECDNINITYSASKDPSSFAEGFPVIPNVQYQYSTLQFSVLAYNISQFSIFSKGIIVNQKMTAIKETLFAICGDEMIKEAEEGVLSVDLWVNEYGEME
jgi:hypothetical protein